MSSNDSVRRTITIALVLCLFCSVIISSAAVLLKPAQQANMLLDRNKNILVAAGIFDPAINTNADVPRMFAEFTPRVADLDEDRFLTDEELAELDIDPATYNQRTVINDEAFSDALSPEEDIASIQRRVRYATVYVIEDDAGGFETIVLPVSGYGLWGMMHAFLALEGDGNTVTGIGFYEQKETPGLGGEVVNPRWRALWPGKQVYDEDGNVVLSVVKGSSDAPNEVDGLSGATITTRGVDNLIQFWLGENGFGPLLANITQDQ